MKKYEQPECSFCDKKGDEKEDMIYIFDKDIRGKLGVFTHVKCLGKVMRSISK